MRSRLNGAAAAVRAAFAGARKRWKVVSSALAIAAAVLGWLVSNGPPLWHVVHRRHHVRPAAVAPPPPLSLTATHDAGALADAWTVIVPDRLRAQAAFSSPAITDCESFWRVVRTMPAADVKTTYVHLTAEGSGPRTSTIIGIRARVLSRQRPLVGAVAECPGGGAEGVIPMRVNLDSASPVALRVVQVDHLAEGRVTGPYFADRSIAVHHGESVSIRIEAITRRLYVVWRIEVTAIVDGRERTYLLGDQGRPFRTAPLASYTASSPVYQWDWGTTNRMLTLPDGLP